jgi:hypothetical protein
VTAARTRLAAATVFVVAAVIAALPGRGAGQRLGLFFDDDAGQCEAPIASFGRAHVWVFAFVPPDSVISGAIFRLLLPPDIEIVEGSLRWARALGEIETYGDLYNGMDVRFGACAQSSSPLLLAEFDIEDQSFGDPRPNLRLDIKGGAVDSVEINDPHFRICDPTDPLGEGRGIFAAPGVHATLNCTAHCGCTTALQTRRWGAVKSMYR